MYGPLNVPGVSGPYLRRAIATHNTSSAAHQDLRQLVGLTADAHNVSDTAHQDIRNFIRLTTGTPLTAFTSAGMTDTGKVYVYTGSESGYTYGNWYYYDSAKKKWMSGGVYNSQALETDTTLTAPGFAADAKTVGRKLEETRTDMNQLTVVNPREISRQIRKECVPDGYYIQDFVYDDTRGRYILACSASDPNSPVTCFLVCRDLNRLKDADRYFVNAHHANGIVIDRANDRMIVASAVSTAADDSYYPYIDMVSLEDFTLLGSERVVITSNSTAGITGICNFGDRYIITDGKYAVVMNQDFSLDMSTMIDIGVSTYRPYFGLDDAEFEVRVLRQNIFYHNGVLYRILSVKDYLDGTRVFVKNGFVKFNFSSGEVLGLSLFHTDRNEEFEGCEAIGGKLLFTSYSNEYIIARELELHERDVSERRHIIRTGTDLNDVMALGEYYCAGGSIAKTLTNLPAVVSRTFSLVVCHVGSYGLMQVIVSANEYSSPYIRTYTEGKGWNGWMRLETERLQTDAVKRSVSALLYTCGTLGGAKKIIRFGIPMNLPFNYKNLEFTSLKATVRHNGQYCLGTDKAREDILSKCIFQYYHDHVDVKYTSDTEIAPDNNVLVSISLEYTYTYDVV